MVLKKPVAVMCFSDGTGGMERSAIRLAKMLAFRVPVVLMCKESSYIESFYKKEDGQFPCEPIRFSSRIFSPSMLIKARSIIRKYGISNVIFLGASELKTLFFAFLGLNLNLIVWHGTTKSKPKRDFFHRLVYSNVNYHVALSEHLLNNVKKIVPFNELANYVVIRPSIYFGNKNIGNVTGFGKAVNIVHVGRIANGKGQLDAIIACLYIKNKGIDFNLVLLGAPDDVSYLDKVKSAILDNKLESSISIAGCVDNVNQYLERADVLLFPSSGEGMPAAFIEALHYDIVCIAYNNTVFPEFMDMGFYVHLAQDGNVSDLSNKLLYVVSNLESEKKKSVHNVHLSTQYFRVDREADQWLDILV